MVQVFTLELYPHGGGDVRGMVCLGFDSLMLAFSAGEYKGNLLEVQLSEDL